MASQSDKDAIRKHIEEIFEAYMKKDREALRSHHSEDWIGYTLNSRAALQGIDAYMENAERIFGSFTFHGYDIIEFNVAVHGDAAVVPYTAKMWGAGTDQEVNIKIRVLDVYARKDGEWNQIATNVSFHPQTIDAFIRGV
ncbi:YybH family protein [Acidobacteriota bacterium]